MKEAESTFKNAKVMEYSSYIDGIMAVQKGVLQGFAIDQTALSYAMATEGIKDIKVLDENVGEPNSIVAGISPNTEYPNLVNEINAFLEQVHSDGTLDDMYQRWVVEAKDEMPEIHTPENPQGKMVIATTGLIPPFSYYMGDELTGMDMELVRRLADYMNVEIQIKTYDFSGINSALEANQCDCIFSNLNATDERAEVMDFSDPVYVSNTKLIVYSPSGENGSFEELCVQTLVPQMKNDPNMRMTLEYSEFTDKAAMNVFHNVNLDEMIADAQKTDASSLSHQSPHGGSFRVGIFIHQWCSCTV